MEINQTPPKFRLITGAPAAVEDWINANWETYVIQNLTYQIVEGAPYVIAMALLKTEVEKAARMMQFAANAQMAPGRRM
jgi:hypothetical protein